MVGRSLQVHTAATCGQTGSGAVPLDLCFSGGKSAVEANWLLSVPLKSKARAAPAPTHLLRIVPVLACPQLFWLLPGSLLSAALQGSRPQPATLGT